MREKLTKRQEQVLSFIIAYLRKEGVPPTLQEIGEALGIRSLRGVTDHLEALERKGYIERLSGSARGIRPMVEWDRSSTVSIPLVGHITAGHPILAQENIEGYIPFPQELVLGSGIYFALKVKGNSMAGDHIAEGDIAIIRQQPSIQPYEIAAVLVGNEATLKRVEQKGKEVYLLSSNPLYPPLKVPAEEVKILGKLVGLLRSYA